MEVTNGAYGTTQEPKLVLDHSILTVRTTPVT
jgi:hypothetical protein